MSWPVQNVVAFTTTIHHPSHKEQPLPYGNFNLGLHVGDNEENVQSNRELLLEYLPVNTSIQWLDQVHGSHVEVIEECSSVITADALTTDKKNIALAIMTADCLPIIISSLDGSEVAAIHGGWKPLSKNIIEHTISKMKTPVKDLHVWLGPCIGPDKFEVGAEVVKQFVTEDHKFTKAFIAFNLSTNESKYLGDLHLIAKIQLKKLGVQHIHSLPHCTFSNINDYYSYRRSYKTGRMATIICRS